MKIYIVRHGITDWNVLGKWQGYSDIPLNEEGIGQAELLALKFKSTHINKIYSSPLSRALKTAEIINQYKNVEIIKHDDIKETNVGEWEGLSLEEIESRYGEVFLNWCKCVDLDCQFGVESIPKMSERAWNIFSHIAQTEDDDILLATHGAWTKAVICIIKGLPFSDRALFDINNTSVTTVEYDKIQDKYTVLSINDVSHIS